MNVPDNRLSEDNEQLSELLTLCGTHQRWLDEMRHAHSPLLPPLLGHQFDQIPGYPPLR